MATMNELLDALRNADAAGRTDDARRLADLITQMQNSAAPRDTSFSSAFQQGIDQPFENMATTARALGMEGTANVLSGATDAPVNYESASDRFINPEQGTQLLVDLVSDTCHAARSSKPVSSSARWRRGLAVLAWALLVASR